MLDWRIFLKFLFNLISSYRCNRKGLFLTVKSLLNHEHTSNTCCPKIIYFFRFSAKCKSTKINFFWEQEFSMYEEMQAIFLKNAILLLKWGKTFVALQNWLKFSLLDYELSRNTTSSKCFLVGFSSKIQNNAVWFLQNKDTKLDIHFQNLLEQNNSTILNNLAPKLETNFSNSLWSAKLCRLHSSRLCKTFLRVTQQLKNFKRSLCNGACLSFELYRKNKFQSYLSIFFSLLSGSNCFFQNLSLHPSYPEVGNTRSQWISI